MSNTTLTRCKLSFVTAVPLRPHRNRVPLTKAPRQYHHHHKAPTAQIKSDTTGSQTMTDVTPGVVRSRMQFVTSDFVQISDPELIRRVSSHADMGRMANSEMPFMFRQFFYGTKFYHPRDKAYAPAILTEGTFEQPQRRQATIDSLAPGFTVDQIDRIEALIKGKDDERTVAIKFAKILAEVILPLPEGEELPDHIAAATYDTLTSFYDTFNPMKYFKARKARAMTEEYITKLMPDEKYPVDIVHNLGAGCQGMSKAILLLRGKTTENAVSTVCKDSMVKGAIRVPIRTTTIDGMFPEDKPLVPDKTLVFMDLAAAALDTEDEKFVFGVGTEHRQCPFKELFLSTTKTIHDRNVSG